MQLSAAVTATMSSLEISELVESRHDSVKRTIERLSERGTIQLPPLVDVKNSQGQTVQVYKIEKRDSYVIVAQLSPEFTARLVDRWQELESQSQLPTDYLSALKALTAEVEERQKLEQTLAIAAPKAKFVDSYVQATGLMGFREVAKLLKIKETEFREFLIDNSIMYRLAGKMTPYANHIDAGRFEVKTGENQDNGRAYTQAKFTPKGVEWIAGLIASHKVKGEINAVV